LPANTNDPDYTDVLQFVINEVERIRLDIPNLQGADPDKIPEFIEKVKYLATSKPDKRISPKKGVVYCRACQNNYETKANGEKGVTSKRAIDTVDLHVDN
jgi:hypothetical protein